jgi:hypothetical protein
MFEDLGPGDGFGHTGTNGRERFGQREPATLLDGNRKEAITGAVV